MADALAIILAAVGLATLIPRLANDKGKSKARRTFEGVWVCFLLPLPLTLLLEYPNSLLAQFVVAISIVAHTILLVNYWVGRRSADKRSRQDAPAA